MKEVGKWIKEGRRKILRIFGYEGKGKKKIERYFEENVDGEVKFEELKGKEEKVIS